MPPFSIGDRVIVLEPFTRFYPGVWTINGINSETGAYQIADGRDFDAKYLQLAETP